LQKKFSSRRVRFAAVAIAGALLLCVQSVAAGESASSESRAELARETGSGADSSHSVASSGQRQASESDPLNGFALTDLRVSRDLVMGAGPPRDGIPRVDAPEMVAAADSRKWVGGHNPVVGVEVNGEARAYPVHLMEHHQIVNDIIAGEAVVVTFDPLTSTPRAYRTTVAGRSYSFGFTGLLYRAGALLYDLETESLWSQFNGRAIAGLLAGSKLTALRTRQERLGDWLARHPDSKVLVRPALKTIDYRHSPYSQYWVSENHPPLPAELEDSTFHPKEVVLGAEVDGVSRAYLGSLMTAAGGRVVDQIRGREIRIAYDGDSATFSWDAPEDVRISDAYWFAWKAFHPKTEVWKLGSPENH
jgi:hypothetical protein